MGDIYVLSLKVEKKISSTYIGRTVVKSTTQKRRNHDFAYPTVQPPACGPHHCTKFFFNNFFLFLFQVSHQLYTWHSLKQSVLFWTWSPEEPVSFSLELSGEAVRTIRIPIWTVTSRLRGGLLRLPWATSQQIWWRGAVHAFKAAKADLASIASFFACLGWLSRKPRKPFFLIK